jgi:plasmid stabilization system protein ParE
MKVRFTEPALDDIDEIRRFLLSNYPSVAPLVEQRIRIVAERIGAWPESSPRVIEFPEIRFAPLGRYPYRVFYKITDETVEILHIHHTSRQPFWEAES